MGVINSKGPLQLVTELTLTVYNDENIEEEYRSNLVTRLNYICNCMVFGLEVSIVQQNDLMREIISITSDDDTSQLAASLIIE